MPDKSEDGSEVALAEVISVRMFFTLLSNKTAVWPCVCTCIKCLYATSSYYTAKGHCMHAPHISNLYDAGSDRGQCLFHDLDVNQHLFEYIHLPVTYWLP